jgi:NADPH:quinone reductase-like Zn-dependent oxidoreductase
LIGYVEAGKLRPAIAATYDLRDIHAAQEAFGAKTHVGKITLRVPQ